MIVSASDVNAEREAARQVIFDWSSQNSESKKIVLLPLIWEADVYPELGDRPQQIINKQLVSRSDFMIGIFWTRVGTATGVAISGSIEEIEKHFQVGKPILLYFSEKRSNYEVDTK